MIDFDKWFWAQTSPGADGCRLWAGPTKPKYNGRADYFFRTAYLLYHSGGIPSDRHWYVRRKCENSLCVARDHLYLARNPSTNAPRPYERLRVPAAHECAYLAGYFDGEGCLVPQANRTRTSWWVTVKFGQVRREGPDFLRDIYGGTVRLVPAARKNKQPQWVWEMGQKLGVRQFLLDVQPYVLEKREQVEAAIALFGPALISEPLSNPMVLDLIRRVRADKVKSRPSRIFSAFPMPAKTPDLKTGQPAR